MLPILDGHDHTDFELICLDFDPHQHHVVAEQGLRMGKHGEIFTQSKPESKPESAEKAGLEHVLVHRVRGPVNVKILGGGRTHARCPRWL